MTTFPHEEAVELVGALRELIATVRVVDAPIEVLSAARLLIDDARAVLDPHRYVGQVAQGALEGEGIGLRTPFVGTPNEFFPYSPIVGPLNPVAPPVRMWADDALRVHGAVTLGAPYNGPPGLVHGGVLALIFDELLGACAVVNQCPGFTGTLTVKYLRGTPIRTPLTMEAWIDRVDGRKTFVSGELRNGAIVTATATGIFISVDHQIVKQ
ncbi:MAG: PaaI family thioesterase [Actinobacteria bacterium]|uniref:Acyl-coenzyme A thioesterase THEM4 n=1 Tax=freshwater metagenome TaxID=449393 RepID=A0A6J6SGR8_9ZZZZ|nr:PaaI family thioesterase [Actinomycetota bacterium]MSW90725.1 PaaI family thioesterase [Actinomycetota bacterium]MSX87737.1 PaaI family thioesterase [Actinomycetota bacterium]MSY71049.1 PaaI family thioesterase [Actinomycetota bacterium]